MASDMLPRPASGDSTDPPWPDPTATILPPHLPASATSLDHVSCVSQATAPRRRLCHVRRYNKGRLSMRVYVEVVVIIISLLGAYVALLPLVT